MNEMVDRNEKIIINAFWIIFPLILLYWHLFTKDEKPLIVLLFVCVFAACWFAIEADERPIYVNWTKFTGPTFDTTGTYHLGMFFLWLPVVAVHYFFKKIRI